MFPPFSPELIFDPLPLPSSLSNRTDLSFIIFILLAFPQTQLWSSMLSCWRLVIKRETKGVYPPKYLYVVQYLFGFCVFFSFCCCFLLLFVFLKRIEKEIQYQVIITLKSKQIKRN